MNSGGHSKLRHQFETPGSTPEQHRDSDKTPAIEETQEYSNIIKLRLPILSLISVNRLKVIQDENIGK